MEQVITIIIITVISIIVGIVAGNGAVYAFNRIPATWLCDYGEKPSDSLMDRETQRIKSVPWKHVFSAIFTVLTIYMAMEDYRYAIAGVVALWLLLLIGVADKKYMIIPDQLVILLGVTGFGFVPFHEEPLNILWGALIGFGSIFVISVVGKLIMKKETIGFGDAKLCGAIGVIVGPMGIVYVMLGGSILAGIIATIGLITKKYKKNQEMPLGPYICLAGAFYIAVINLI